MTPTELRLIRLRAGVRQFRVAEIMGISPTYLSNIEQGRRSIPNSDFVSLYREAVKQVKEADHADPAR